MNIGNRVRVTSEADSVDRIGEIGVIVDYSDERQNDGSQERLFTVEFEDTETDTFVERELELVKG